MAKKRKQIKRINNFLFSKALLPVLITFFLRLLVLVSLVGFFGGIVKTLLGLQLLFDHSVEEALRELLLNVITLLAVVEVIRTVMSYLSEGRVKVTFIVDTVLIVMLNEIISLWFRGPTLTSVTVLVIMIATLIFVRLLAIRFSPDGD
ncbi:MAG: phosphate-starvation-inducible PsiE family protein [Candidatus Levybacteria bacterium]|nr:phosphate-starvation-inducible PsiE family protein [Candidatus Levybacteria bacterium]